MKNKLFVNANHFLSEKMKMSYIKSRTKNNAIKHLKFRMRRVTVGNEIERDFISFHTEME